VLSRTEEPLTLQETLSTFALRLSHLIPFDSIAVFIAVDDVLSARFALGENARQLSSLRIRVGEGLAGWVAETGNSIINGNPTVEPGLERLKNKLAVRSAMAVPLISGGRTVGVLAVYSAQTDGFTPAHLGVIEAGACQLGVLVANRLDTEPGWHTYSKAKKSDTRGRARRSSADAMQSNSESFLTSIK